jgi:hypothetical protein
MSYAATTLRLPDPCLPLTPPPPPGHRHAGPGRQVEEGLGTEGAVRALVLDRLKRRAPAGTGGGGGGWADRGLVDATLAALDDVLAGRPEADAGEELPADAFAPPAASPPPGAGGGGGGGGGAAEEVSPAGWSPAAWYLSMAQVHAF